MPLQNIKFDREIREFLEAASGDEGLLLSSPDAFYEKYKDYLPSYPSGEYKKTLFNRVFLNNKEQVKVPETTPLYSEEEVAFLSGIESAYLRKIMLCLLSWAKRHPHESGWVKYDLWAILDGFFTVQQIDKVQHSGAMASLAQYGFDMRVIGSKNPIVCYMVPELGGEKIKTEAEVWEHVCPSDKSIS